MYEASDFRKMQTDYLEKYRRELSIKHSQLLYASYHPLFGEGDFLLMLELLIDKETAKIRKMDTPQTLES